LPDDRPVLATAFLADGSGPRRARGLGREVFDNIQIVEAAQAGLQRAKRARDRHGVRGVDRGGQVGQVAPVPNTDPETVKPSRGRLSTRLTMRFTNGELALPTDLLEIEPQCARAARGGAYVQAHSDPLEESEVTLRSERRPEEFPPDPGVVGEAHPEAPKLDPLPRGEGAGLSAQDVEGDVAIPHPADEAREALEPSIVESEFDSASGRNCAGPDLEADPEPAEFPVEPVERFGPRLGCLDHPVDIVERLVQPGLEDPGQSGGVARRLRTTDQQDHRGAGGLSIRGKWFPLPVRTRTY
jgi:hypothetical protein